MKGNLFFGNQSAATDNISASLLKLAGYTLPDRIAVDMGLYSKWYKRTIAGQWGLCDARESGYTPLVDGTVCVEANGYIGFEKTSVSFEQAVSLTIVSNRKYYVVKDGLLFTVLSDSSVRLAVITD